MEKFDVLFIENEEHWQKAYARGLANHGIQVAVAGNGEDGLKTLEKRGENIDLVLLDYLLPDGLGREFLAIIRSRWPDIPVIVLTAATLEPSVRADLLGMGAADFVVKSDEFVELAARIRIRTRISNANAPNVRNYRFGGWTLDVPHLRLMDPEGTNVALSTQEREILLKFLQNPGIVIGRDELASTLHSPEILNRRIGCLRRRLRDDTECPKFIATVHGQGYQFIQDVTAA